MKLKKKIVIMFVGLLTVCYLFSYPKVGARSQQTISSYSLDHNKDSKKAKKWAETKYATWKKTLSKNEERSLASLLHPPQEKEKSNLGNINHQLKVYGGDLSARAIDTPIANKNLQDHIDRISQAINRKEGKLDQPLIVYKNETLKEVIHIEDKRFRQHDSTLDETKVRQLKEDFAAGLYSEFRIYDLFEDPKQDQMIKWKIELPAGTATGLITEDKIVIDKDSAFKVTDIKLIPQKGKQLIRIDAKLMPKEIVIHEIKQLTDHLQHDFNTRLELPVDKQIIDFKLTGAASLFMAKKLSGLIDKFIQNIDNTLIQKIFVFMAEKGGHLTFTDRKLYTLPPLYDQKRKLSEVMRLMDAFGFYNIDGNRTVAVHLPEDLKEQATLSIETLFHELGHVVDNYGALYLKTGLQNLSDSDKFNEIWEKEGANLTDYGREDPDEFFAEAFWLIHSSEKNTVKEKAPQTYVLLNEVIEILIAS